MREVILRPDAEADIEDAADYTIAQWGHEQAKTYVGELRQAIELLSTTALRHPLYDAIQPGLRRKRSGMHHIYYLATKDCVEAQHHPRPARSGTASQSGNMERRGR